MYDSLLVVAVEEIRFTKELEDVKLDKVGVDASFECELSKDGQKVEWFKDSKKIRPDMEHDIQVEGKTHRLVVKKATPKDMGTYRADFMHLSTSAKLAIEGSVHSNCCRASSSDRLHAIGTVVLSWELGSVVSCKCN